MLTKISLTIALIIAVINVAILFGVDISEEQLAGINTALVAAGAVVHAWFNPAVPFGNKEA